MATRKKKQGARATSRRTATATKRTKRTKRTKSAAATPAVQRAPVAAPARRAAPGSLPRDPKGGRSQFYADPAIDQLWAVVTAITGEVSVAFDRLDTIERLLDAGGAVTRASIEAYRPDDAVSAERARRREELIRRVFQVLSQYGQ